MRFQRFLLLFSFSILLFSVGSFFVSPISIHASTTVDYVVTSGTDATGSVPESLSSAGGLNSDISRLSTSDDRRMQSSAMWPAEGVYEESRYIEFLFNPGVPADADILNVTLANEYRNSTDTKIHHAKLQIWDGESFVDQGLTVKNSTEDVPESFDITSILNTAEKINNTKIRFLAYRDTSGKAHTSHDFVGLSVTYDIAELSAEGSSSSSTSITSNITEDTTWTLAGSPYIVQNSIDIVSDATLTIEPGVVVKFAGSFTVYVFGKIIANGEEGGEIHFTSVYDGTVGGVTDDSKNPSIRDWEGIYFKNSTGSNFKNVSFRYASTVSMFEFSEAKFENSNIGNNWNGMVIFDGSHVDVTGGIFDGLSRDAFSLIDEGSLYLSDSIISNISGRAIDLLRGSSLILDGVEIFNIKRQALSLGYESVFHATGVKINDVSGDGIVIHTFSSGIFNDGSVKNIKGFSWNNPVVVLDDSSFSASDSVFESGVGDGLDFYANSTLALYRSVVKNFPGTGVILDNWGNAPESLNINSIKDSIITGNDIGIKIFNYSQFVPSVPDITGNLIYGNISLGVWASGDTSFSLVGNWWGDASGPYHETLNPEGLGDAVSDNVLFDPWCTDESCVPPAPARNPVVIVPGLFGTEIYKPNENGLEKLWFDFGRIITDIGDEFLDALQFNSDLTPMDTSLSIGEVIRRETIDLIFGDPTIFNYSFGLVEEFKTQGYTEGEDLFLFPYDWRYGVNEDNTSLLGQKIAEALSVNGAEKTDIVAHSTGGLLVKKYVADNPETHNIGKAVFVGVPNTGAPKALKALLAGDGFGIPFLAEERMQRIAQNLPVAYELSPSEQYFNTKGSYLKIIEARPFGRTARDLSFVEANDFLINYANLNSTALVGAHALHTADFDDYDLRTAGIDLYAVNGCRAGTIGKVVEVRHFTLFDSKNYSSRYQVEMTPGDGTVPLESATNLPTDAGNKYYGLSAKHSEMLSQEGIRQQIVNIISGSDLETKKITQDISECKLKGRAISVFSPIAISVTDQDGNYLGLAEDGVTIKNNIPNAEFQIIGEHKFVYLPTDEGQIYTTSITGTGTGTFTITDATIEDDVVTQTQVFSDIFATPSLLGKIILSDDTDTVLTLDTNGDGEVNQMLEPSAILDAEESQNFTPLPPNGDSDSPSDDAPNPGGPSSSGGRVMTIKPSSNLALRVNIPPIPVIDLVSDTPAQSRIGRRPSLIILEGQSNSTSQSDVVSEEKRNSPQNRMLAANVQDSNTPSSNTAIIVTLAGVLGILFLAKLFFKL